MRVISLAFICDDSFVMQTATAVTSCTVNKKPDSVYKIFIITSNVSAKNLELLNKLSRKNCHITIIEGNTKKLEGLHNFRQGGYLSATEAALLKFELPEILPELEKVIYLDGDIIVKKDLSELFDTDLENNYVAAAHDTGKIYFKHEYVKKYPQYFNSGVMLLNLKKMREDNITQKLIQTKKAENDQNLMDQNIFNIVFADKIKIIDIRWNFLCINLLRAKNKWTISDINNLFNSNYKDFEDIKNKAVIFHYSSKDKPWKYSDIPFANLWFSYYKKSPFKNFKLKRKTLTKHISFLEQIFSIRNEENFHKVIRILGLKFKIKNKYKELDDKLNQIRNSNKFDIDRLKWENSKKYNNQETNSGIKISVIIPIYNNDKYIKTCLESILNQTLKDIEIICIDDESTDSSLEILKEYKNKYNNIHLITQKHSKQGAARNKGLEIAKGKYITFVDSDDYLKDDMLEKLYKLSESKNAELTICNIKNTNNDLKLNDRTDRYQKYYDSISSSKTFTLLDENNFLKQRTGPVAKLYKKEIIEKFNLRFPENLIQEDEAFYWYYLTKINSYHTINEYLYYRLIHNESVMYKKEANFQNITDHLIICKKIYNHLKAYDLYEIYKNIFSIYTKKVINNTKKRCLSIEESKKTEELIKDLTETILKDFPNDCCNIG